MTGPPATCSYDVLCFGKVLLELVTGNFGISGSNDAASEEWLASTLSKINGGDKASITSIIDPLLVVDEDHQEEVWAVAIIAKTCLSAKPSGLAGLLPVQLGAAAELVVAELVAVRVPGEPPPPGAQPGPAALGAVARERRRRGGVLLVLVQEVRGGDGGRAGAGGGARRGRRRCVALACRVGAPHLSVPFHRHS